MHARYQPVVVQASSQVMLFTYTNINFLNGPNYKDAFTWIKFFIQELYHHLTQACERY